MLGALVRDGLLLSDGSGRGMIYFLPWQRRPAASFDLVGDEIGTEDTGAKPPELGAKPPELNGKPPELGEAKAASEAIYLDWETIPEPLRRELIELGLRVSGTGRVPPAVLRETLLGLCAGRYLGLRVLAQVLHRDPDDLRKRTLSQMVRDGQLRTAYPAIKDPRQAYTAGITTENDKE